MSLLALNRVPSNSQPLAFRCGFLSVFFLNDLMEYSIADDRMSIAHSTTAAHGFKASIELELLETNDD